MEGIGYSNGEYKLVNYEENDPKPENLILEIPTGRTETCLILSNGVKIAWFKHHYYHDPDSNAKIIYKDVIIEKVIPAINTSTILSIIISFAGKAQQELEKLRQAILERDKMAVDSEIQSKKEELSKIEEEIDNKKKELREISSITDMLRELNLKLNEHFNQPAL